MYWTVDDIMAHEPCWKRSEVERAFGGRKRLNLRQLLDTASSHAELRWVLRSILPREECVCFSPQKEWVCFECVRCKTGASIFMPTAQQDKIVIDWVCENYE